VNNDIVKGYAAGPLVVSLYTVPKKTIYTELILGIGNSISRLNRKSCEKLST